MFKTSNMKFGSFSGNSSTATTNEKTSGSSNQNGKGSSSKDTNKITGNDFVPKRFGLKFDPPTIILEYLVPSSGKLYHHKMKLPKLKSDSDTAETIDYLKNRHFQYFINNKISEAQLRNLIEKLKKKLESEEKGSGSQSAFLTNVGLNFGSSNNQNKTGTNKLGPLSSISNKNFDSESDENKKTNTFSKPFQSSNKTSDLKTSNSKDKNNGFWDFEEIDLPDGSDKKLDYNTTNLNTLSKQEIDLHKKKMDVVYNKNRKDPNDPDFVYDVQEEFQPHEDNEWDEDLEF